MPIYDIWMLPKVASSSNRGSEKKKKLKTLLFYSIELYLYHHCHFFYLNKNPRNLIMSPIYEKKTQLKDTC